MSEQESDHYALSLLGAREHSRKELAQKLSRKGFSDEQIDATVKRLLEHNYLSDQRYAEAFARSKVAKPLGKQRILNELRTKGISDEMAKQALGTLDADWFELALSLKRRKFGHHMAKDVKERSRQTRYLAYRGFSYDEIRYAVESNEDQDISELR